MTRITLGLAIMIGSFLQSFVVTATYVFHAQFTGGGMPSNFSSRIDLFSNIVYVIAFFIANYLHKKIKEEFNLSMNNGTNFLLVGVTIFLLQLIVFYVIRLVPYAVYALGSLPFGRYLLENPLLSIVARACVTYGLMVIFLFSTRRNKDAERAESL